jgi:hypothetical protein
VGRRSDGGLGWPRNPEMCTPSSAVAMPTGVMPVTAGISEENVVFRDRISKPLGSGSLASAETTVVEIMGKEERWGYG